MTEELYGLESVFTKIENIYEIDLKFLTKLDGTEIEYQYGEINYDYYQNISQVLLKINTFINLLKINPNKIKSISYKSYDDSILNPEYLNELEKIDNQTFKDIVENSAFELKENIKKFPRPWDDYFTKNKIIDDLLELKNSLECLKKNNCETFYLRVG